ncbi:putative DNA-binding protein [Arabidopsis thaliana]
MAKTALTPPASGSEVPRSGTPGDASGNKPQTDATGVSATDTASQKRGRGRPPKAKSDSSQIGAVSAKASTKPSGRPKRNVAQAVLSTSVAAAVKKRGRAKRSTVTAAVVTTATGEGSRKRGRPKKDDVAAATVPAETVVAPAKRRGRKPTVEVAAQPVRRTRKSTSVAPVAANVGDLKKRTALLQKKVKEAAAKLKQAVTAIDEVQKLADGM